MDDAHDTAPADRLDGLSAEDTALIFEAGWVACKKGWADCDMINPPELPRMSSLGDPLIILCPRSGMSISEAQLTAALTAQGREVVVVTEDPLPDEVSVWLPSGRVHVIGQDCADDGEPSVERRQKTPLPGAAANRTGSLLPRTLHVAQAGSDEGGVVPVSEQRLFYLGVDDDLGRDLAPGEGAAVAALMRQIPVAFAWDRPILWMESDGRGACNLTTLQEQKRNRGSCSDLDVVRQAPETDTVVYDGMDESARVEQLFGSRPVAYGAPIMYLNVYVGEGQALLACAFHFAERVFTGPDVADDSWLDRFHLSSLMGTQDWNAPERARYPVPGLPTAIAAYPPARQIVTQVLAGVATELFCEVIARGIRHLLSHTGALDEALQRAWTNAAEQLEAQ